MQFTPVRRTVAASFLMSASFQKRRVIFDRRGNACWDGEPAFSRFSRDKSDSDQLIALSSHLSLAEPIQESWTGLDSYNAYLGRKYERGMNRRRRSLDELRQLSEHIKRVRQIKSDGK